MPSDRAFKEPVLTNEEIKQVNDVIQWSQTHENCMYFGSLVTVLRLLEFVYNVKAFRVASRPVGEIARILEDPSLPVANTRGATPPKG